MPNRSCEEGLRLRALLNHRLATRLIVAVFCVAAFLGPRVRAAAQNISPEARGKIVALFEQARQAEQRGDLLASAGLYEKILALDPTLAEVWANKGLVLYELQKHQEAVSAFEKAAALKPALLTPHLFLGIEYLRLGEASKAVPALKSALAVEPHHLQASYELANAYAALDRFELAIENYQNLLRNNPGMEQAWYRLGIAYMNWSKAAGLDLVDAAPPSSYGNILLAELQAVAGIVGDAEKNYRRALETMPDSVEARLGLGRFFLDLEKSPERRTAARDHFEAARSLAPGDLRVALAMTRLALVEQNYADALTLLGEILETDAPFARAQLPTLLAGFSLQELEAVISGSLEQRGGVPDKRYCAAADGPVPALLYAAYLELGDTRQAEECRRSLSNEVQAVESEARRDRPGLNSYSHRLEQLEQASNSRPLALAERQELALCSFHVGQYDRALRALVEILNHSENRPAQYWLSHACRALAREAFLKAIRLNPDSYRTHLLLADLANDRHDTTQALEEYEKAVSLGAADPEVHVLLVQFLRSKGRADEALAKAQVAIQKFPAHPRLNCELGQLLLGMKKPLEAAPRFERSLAADPSLVEARAGLADSYAAMGETEKAIREMKQALSDDPDGSYHYRLGRWLQMSGRAREAAEAFSVSTELKQERSRKERERFLSIRRGT